MKKAVPAKKSFPVWAWGVLALVLVAALAIVLALSASQRAGSPQAAAPAASSAGGQTVDSLPLEISVAEASQKRDQGAFILDVRQPEEWTSFHIPGATLIPLGELPNRLNEVPKDKQVVVVCRTGHRSASGRDILLKAGFTNVTSMAGGVTQWQAQGLPIATGN
jgi:rhodanese-related sulfurtransferase